MTHKFATIEELNEEREKIDSKYESGLPEYLVDYFDSKEKKILENEFYSNLYKLKGTKSKEEQQQYMVDKKETFWKENEFQLVKGSSRSVVEESQRNTQRIEDERELSDEEIKVLVHLCSKDLYLFAIRYFNHYLKKPSSKFHKYLYRLLTKEVSKKRKGFKWAIAAPRFNSKSSIMSAIFPLWCICYNKKRFIILISDTAGQACDFLSDIKRELKFNDKLRKDFPHAVGSWERDREDEIITSNQIKVIALGTGNKIRGRRFGIYRPDLILGDDLENQEMVRSDTKRNNIKDWFDKDVLFAGGEEGTETDFLVCGTILGKDSLLNKLLNPEFYPEWKSTRFSAVIKLSTSTLWDEWWDKYRNRFDKERENTALTFFEENKEEMLRGTEVLWPEGDPYYNLMIWKYSKPSAYLTEKQNSPVDLTKVLVQENQIHWKNFQSDKDIVSILKNKRQCFYFGWLDPSLGKKSDSGDYSCIVTICRDIKTGYLLVVDINLKRRSVDDQIKEILKLHRRFKYKRFGVESNAFQYVVADSLRKISRKEGIYVPVEDVNVFNDKKMRFEGILPFIVDGTLIFDSYKYKNNQQYFIGMDQILSFTGDNDEHDDCPDALASCAEMAKGSRFKLLTKSTKRNN